MEEKAAFAKTYLGVVHDRIHDQRTDLEFTLVDHRGFAAISRAKREGAIRVLDVDSLRDAFLMADFRLDRGRMTLSGEWRAGGEAWRGTAMGGGSWVVCY